MRKYKGIPVLRSPLQTAYQRVFILNVFGVTKILSLRLVVKLITIKIAKQSESLIEFECVKTMSQ